MNKLTILERNLPLRAYPNEELNKAILGTLLPWLGSLLSLSGEKSKEQLKNVFEPIKVQCIGMGFSEIKKMFETYADGKLPIQPIPNYFNRILLGQIVRDWKSINKRNPKEIPIMEKQLTAEEKEFIMIEGVDRIKKEYEQNGTISSNCCHLYRYLRDKNVFPPHTPQFVQAILKRAKSIDKDNLALNSQIKKEIDKIEKGRDEDVNIISRRLILEDYFKGENKRK